MSDSSKSFIDILCEHILRVYDSDGKEIMYNTINIKNEKRMYSISYSNVLYIDNIPLTNKQLRSYRVLYKCRCGRENNILLQKYLAKTKIICQHCLQDHSFEDSVYSNNIGANSERYIPRKKNVMLEFNDMNDVFKEDYKSKHLTEDELFYYLPYIYRINNHLIRNVNIKDIKYLYAVQTNNQTKFTSKISFDNGVTYETITSVYLLCDVCKKEFKIHLNNIRNKNITKDIRCRKCVLTNKRYKISLYDDSGLTYQSKLEKYFIDMIKSNNIEIVNGFEIPYSFNGKIKKYISDFYLPKYKMIIEIKDYNQFYKNDLKTGKFQAKKEGALEFGKEHNMTYLVLFPQDIDDFIKSILNKEIV